MLNCTLDRLESATRADSFDQGWTLDGLGNFSEFDDDNVNPQTRTVNEANEIESIGGEGSWVTPQYDAAGNMIFAPRSVYETLGVHHVFDAWNRPVAVYMDNGNGVFEPGAGDTLLAQYECDGANRRIEKVIGPSETDYYYNHQWQLLE